MVCQNANSLNSSAFCCSLLACFLPCIPAFLFRRSARDKYNIEVGSYVGNSAVTQSPSFRVTAVVTAVPPGCVHTVSSARSPGR